MYNSLTAGNRPPRRAPLVDVTVRDREGSLVARVTRHRVPDQDLDYVALSDGDDLVTCSVEDVPALMRALLRALNAGAA